MRRQDVPDELLQDVKNNLNITWNDEATDTNIRGLIASGTVFLDSKGGTEFDYEADGMPRTLLKISYWTPCGAQDCARRRRYATALWQARLTAPRSSRRRVTYRTTPRTGNGTLPRCR